MIETDKPDYEYTVRDLNGLIGLGITPERHVHIAVGAFPSVILHTEDGRQISVADLLSKGGAGEAR